MAVTRGPDSEESARQRETSRVHAWKRISAAAAAVAAVVAVLASLTSLFDWFDARVGSEPVERPRTIDTRIEGVSFKGRQPLGDYLRDTNQSLQGLSRRELREPGLLFTVRVRLRGGIGREFPLVWTIYDLRRQAAVSDDLYEQETVTFVPEAPSHARAWPAWVPYPPRPGRYRFDFVLQDDKRQPVDERSSEAITLQSIPALG